MPAKSYRPDRIRKLRKELDQRQYVVAFRAGISQGHLSAIERGGVDSIQVDTLRKLAAYFGVSVAYLAGETDDRRPMPELETDVQYTAEEVTLIEAFRQIQTPTLRALALEMVKAQAEADKSLRATGSPPAESTPAAPKEPPARQERRGVGR